MHVLTSFITNIAYASIVCVQWQKHNGTNNVKLSFFLSYIVTQLMAFSDSLLLIHSHKIVSGLLTKYIKLLA